MLEWVCTSMHVCAHTGYQLLGSVDGLRGFDVKYTFNIPSGSRNKASKSPASKKLLLAGLTL
jgi:hypothetical protein